LTVDAGAVIHLIDSIRLPSANLPRYFRTSSAFEFSHKFSYFTHNAIIIIISLQAVSKDPSSSTSFWSSTFHDLKEEKG